MSQASLEQLKWWTSSRGNASAYKIWEEVGRPDGRYDDDWKRAGEEVELTEQDSDDGTRANQQADDKFAREDGEREPAKPPSVASRD